jgi:hypothetical protein
MCAGKTGRRPCTAPFPLERSTWLAPMRYTPGPSKRESWITAALVPVYSGSASLSFSELIPAKRLSARAAVLMFRKRRSAFIANCTPGPAEGEGERPTAAGKCRHHHHRMQLTAAIRMLARGRGHEGGAPDQQTARAGLWQRGIGHTFGRRRSRAGSCRVATHHMHLSRNRKLVTQSSRRFAAEGL